MATFPLRTTSQLAAMHRVLLLAVGLVVCPSPAIAVVDFGARLPSPAVREVAQWVFARDDHGGRSVVIVDKQEARVFVLDAGGRLVGDAPVLLGSARGDHSAPGVGDKPLSQIRPEERTTPAGRFVAEPGVNAQGEDIVWVDYASAVSMHRVRARVKSERRLERLATPTPQDNRISYGCINLPKAFYETVLAPRARTGAVIYVLPETRTPAQVFGLPDPTARPLSWRARPDGAVRQRLLTPTDGSLLAAH
ncbi:MAG: hypothetical protein RL522_1306 [Pseudomonadota bacterium]|jgi:hypothetical protein